MANYSKFNAFTGDLINGAHNFGSHAFKVMLTDTAPVATNTVKANITEITAAGNYPAGGFPVTVTAGNSAGIETVKLSNVAITAGATIGPFRYAVVYNDTAAGKPLVGFYDYASETTLSATDQFGINFDQTNGLFQVA